MGLVARNEGKEEVGIEVTSGQKLFLDACSLCGAPLAVIGESATESPVCKACAED